MARTLLVCVLVGIATGIIVFALGRLLDSETLTSVAAWAGAGAGAGYFISTRMGKGRDDSSR
jgi:hypothetical protein